MVVERVTTIIGVVRVITVSISVRFHRGKYFVYFVRLSRHDGENESQFKGTKMFE